MIEFYILLATSVLIFLILPFILKSNAVFMFLLLCASELVAKQVSVEDSKFVSSFITSSSIPIYSIVQIVILTFGPLFILLVYKNTLQAKNIIFNLLVGLASAVVFIELVATKLPFDQSRNIENASLYQTLEAFLGVALVTGLVGSIIYLVANKPHSLKAAKHHK